MKKLIPLILLATALASHAQNLSGIGQWFKLDEGSGTTTSSAVGANIGYLTNNGGAVLPTWDNVNVAPLPAPLVSTASVYFDASQGAPMPSIVTDYPGSGASGVITGTVARTVCLWMKADTTKGQFASRPVLFAYGIGTVTDDNWTLCVLTNGNPFGNGTVEFSIGSTAKNQYNYGTSNVLDGAWHFIALAEAAGQKANQPVLYVDGGADPLLNGKNDSIKTAVTDAGPLGTDWVHIGGSGVAFYPGGSANNDTFQGWIDDVRIYTNQLTANDIQALFLGAVAPTISHQPTNRVAILGATNAVNFGVSVSGSTPLVYQWYQGNTSVSLLTNNSGLMISPPTCSSIGSYTVVITNGSGSITSSPAVTLSYITGPVSPAGAAALSGAPVTFTLTGMPAYQTYTYQWTHAGTNLPSGMAASLTLASASATDAGTYTVVATLGSCSATSSPVVLSVLSAPSQSYGDIVTADTPVAWWRLDDAPGSTTAAELIGGYTGTVEPAVTFGVEGALLGDSDTCAQFTGYGQGNAAGQCLIYTASDNYAAALNPAVFSIECWAMLGGSGGFTPTREPLAAESAATATGYNFTATSSGAWQFTLGNGTAGTVLTGPPIAYNQWVHLVGTYDGTTAAFYVNGVLYTNVATAFAPNTFYPLLIGAGQSQSVTGGNWFPGRIDEVAVYNTALSLSQVQAHYAGAAFANAAPRFTQQPLSRATLSGEDYNGLSANVWSAPPVSLQWQQNGTNYPSATSSSLVFNPVSSAQAGTYTLVATYGSLSSTSAPVILTVTPGMAVSFNVLGAASTTVASQGGYAGYVRLTHWNEGFTQSAQSLTNFIDNRGNATTMAVTYANVQGNRDFKGPILAVSPGDIAMLGSLNQAQPDPTSPTTFEVDSIPIEYQQAGYSVYVYMGVRSASVLVDPTSYFGFVTLGGDVTNYWQGIDTVFFDGNFYPATTTDPNATPSLADYAVFTGLSSPTVTITLGNHPTLTGPAFISGVQIVTPARPTITCSLSGGYVVLTWLPDFLGYRLLQQTANLNNGISSNPADWTAVPNSATTNSVTITPTGMNDYYRLVYP